MVHKTHHACDNAAGVASRCSVQRCTCQTDSVLQGRACPWCCSPETPLKEVAGTKPHHEGHEAAILASTACTPCLRRWRSQPGQLLACRMCAAESACGADCCIRGQSRQQRTMKATKPQFLPRRRCSSWRGHITFTLAMGPKRRNSRFRICALQPSSQMEKLCLTIAASRL